MFKTATKIVEWSGLKFKIKKCTCMAMPSNDPQIHIQRKNIPKIFDNDSLKYVGVESTRIFSK